MQGIRWRSGPRKPNRWQTAPMANGIQIKIKVKGQKLGTVALEQMFQIMAPNHRFCQGLNKPQQLLQSWSQAGELTTYLMDKMWSWCAPLSFPYICMSVNQEPWLQSYRKGHRPLRWYATGAYLTFRTRTMLPTRRFAERSKQPLEMNSWLCSRNGNWDGLTMSEGILL